MSLAERLKQSPTQVHRGSWCSVGELLMDLPQDERDALAAALVSRVWTEPAIYEHLIAEGHEVARQTISRHRNGRCLQCRAAGIGQRS